MDTLSLAEAIYYDPEYSGSEDDMTNIRAIQAAIDQRIADARAAGYAEAIEACIQECEIEICELTKGPLISNHATYPYNLMMQRFRALAPATTKEPK